MLEDEDRCRTEVLGYVRSGINGPSRDASSV